jgi:hypothetical protein
MIEIGGVPPRGVRDDMAVVAEERLDGLEDAGRRDRALARGAAIEHLVAKLLAVAAPTLSRVGGEDRCDLRLHLLDLVAIEDPRQPGPAVALELRARVRRPAAVHTEVLEDPFDHVCTTRRPPG